jgi:hypothetical protein
MEKMIIMYPKDSVANAQLGLEAIKCPHGIVSNSVKNLYYCHDFDYFPQFSKSNFTHFILPNKQLMKLKWIRSTTFLLG